jgi:hypothetical protein
MAKRRPSEYLAWANAIQRCENPKNEHYPRWGGRGIHMCAIWRASYRAFLADMGPKPTPTHQLDRIDNSKGYEPGNCRWATPTEQSSNTRRNRFVEFDGVTLTISAWARKLGIPEDRIRGRLDNGWTTRDALMVETTRAPIGKDGRFLPRHAHAA